MFSQRLFQVLSTGGEGKGAGQGKQQTSLIRKVHVEKGVLVSRKGRSKDFIKSVASVRNLKGWAGGKGRHCF